MPDLSILIQMAEFYDVEIKEILDGERRNGDMDQKLTETLSKVADYNKLEKEKVERAGNIAFSLTFLVCAAAIVIQMLTVGNLQVVLGETVTLLVGGIAYMGLMVHHGVWETGSGVKNSLCRDLLISVLCGGIFTAILALIYIQKGAALSLTMRLAAVFFAVVGIVGFAVLRALAAFSQKRKSF